MADGQLITLSFGRTKGAIPATGLISLRAVCTGGEQGKPVQLALWGNGGKLLGRAADPDPLPLGRSGWQLSRPTPTRFGSLRGFRRRRHNPVTGFDPEDVPLAVELGWRPEVIRRRHPPWSV